MTTSALAGPDDQAVLLRHAETAWSLAGRHTGRTDVGLTEEGRRVAESRREELAAVPFARVLCSPLQRARATAALVGWSDPDLLDDLLEWDYGAYEGLTRAEVQARQPGWVLWRDGAPGGEAPGDVRRRVERVVGLLRGGPSPTLVVAHGHVLRALTTAWLDQPMALGAHLALDAGATCTLGTDRGVAVIRRWNEGPSRS